MTDEEIATRLAEAMGWEDDSKNCSTCGGTGEFIEKGLPAQVCSHTYLQYRPTERWSDCGIALEWAQQQFGPFRTDFLANEQMRHSQFGDKYDKRATPVYSASVRDLTPRHICMAILKAVEG